MLNLDPSVGEAHLFVCNRSITVQMSLVALIAMK